MLAVRGFRAYRARVAPRGRELLFRYQFRRSWNTFGRHTPPKTRNFTGISTKFLLAVLCIVSFGAKLYVSSQQPLLNEWDERFHAVVAKNIADHNEYLRPTLYRAPILKHDGEAWARSEVWTHKQPLTFWVMAAFIECFGATVPAVRLPSILFATLSTVLVFLLGRRLFTDRVGWWAAGLFAIHGLTNQLVTGVAATDHVDVHFMFYLLLAGYFTVYGSRGHTINWRRVSLVGLSIGAAVLVKWLPAYTLLLTYLAYWWPKAPRRTLFIESSVIVATSVAVWLPWQIYAAMEFPDAYLVTQLHNYKHLTEGLEGHGQGVLFFFGKSIFNYGEVWVAAVLLVAYRVYAGYPTRRSYLFLLVWIAVPLLFFSLASTKMQGYIYFTAPAIFVASGVAFEWLRRRERYRGLPIGKLAIALFCISPVVHCYESLTPRPPDPTRVARIEALRGELTPGSIVLGSPTPYNDMFSLGAAAAYDYLPDGATVDSLRAIYPVRVEN